ncbi:MAG TPA: ABC transporter substrate-binding protein [Candidatus Dormibacteraeota bacterium]|jgi:polar amino acid transport system substrate-binding protein|nr:ABC transporter substrate-binding protein [Candidatus Dormibacteraeota bacterium]
MRYWAGAVLAGLVAATVGFGTAGPAQAACEPDKVATKYPGLAGKTLKVGLDPTLPPIMYRDPNNPSKIIGQDPDMIEAAMKCLGLKYELVGLDFGTLVPTLQAGQIQLIWSNIYYTPARAQAADFVNYATTGTAGIVKKGNPKGIKTIDDVCGKRAAPILGTVEDKGFQDASAKCVAAGKPAIEITPYPNAPATSRAIENDRADLSMYDVVLVDQVVRSNPDKFERAYYFRSNIKVGVAVKKGNEELVTAVKDAITELQANGTQKALMQKNGIDPTLAIPVEIGR